MLTFSKKKKKFFNIFFIFIIIVKTTNNLKDPASWFHQQQYEKFSYEKCHIAVKITIYDKISAVSFLARLCSLICKKFENKNKQSKTFAKKKKKYLMACGGPTFYCI